MRKIRLITGLLMIVFSLTVYSKNEYSIENLKKNDLLIKETLEKCKKNQFTKKDEACINVQKVQNELAREIWDKNKNEIKNRLVKLYSEIDAGNFDNIFSEMPPKFLKFLSEQASMSEKDLKMVAKEVAKEAFDKYGARTENDKKFKEIKVGRTSVGRTYAIISHKIRVSVNNEVINSEEYILAFEDRGKWYSMSLNKNFFIIFEIYPDFEEIEFSPSYFE